MDKDKNALTFGIIIIIAVSVTITGIIGLIGFGAFPQITGFSNTQTGTATVNISEMISILLLDTNISFGNGTVTQGADWGTIDSCGGTSVNGSWAARSDFFNLSNDGNVLANVSVKIATHNFVGGNDTFATSYYNYTNLEAGSCLLDGLGAGTFQEWTADATDSVSCQKLNFSDATDTIKYCLKLKIPSDTPVGVKSSIVTFTATKSA